MYKISTYTATILNAKRDLDTIYTEVTNCVENWLRERSNGLAEDSITDAFGKTVLQLQNDLTGILGEMVNVALSITHNVTNDEILL
jgi:hypothetical protein